MFFPSRVCGSILRFHGMSFIPESWMKIAKMLGLKLLNRLALPLRRSQETVDTKSETNPSYKCSNSFLPSFQLATGSVPRSEYFKALNCYEGSETSNIEPKQRASSPQLAAGSFRNVKPKCPRFLPGGETCGSFRSGPLNNDLLPPFERGFLI